MEVLSTKFPGRICICEECGALLGNIQESDIYEDSYIYCPICHNKQKLEYNKSYNGIIKNPNSLA